MAENANDSGFFAALLDSIVVWRVRNAAHEAAGGHRHSSLRLEILARIHPPGAGDDDEEAIVRMEVRAAHVAGQPLEPHDVRTGLARIAETAEEFVAAVEQAMASDMGFKWRERADEFLKSQSWESVWANMSHLIAQALDSKQKKPVSSAPSVVSPKRQVQKVAAGETARV